MKIELTKEEILSIPNDQELGAYVRRKMLITSGVDNDSTIWDSVFPVEVKRSWYRSLSWGALKLTQKQK